MAWYGSGSIWRKRAAITLYSSSDLAQDFDVRIPGEFDDFWTDIDASGNELRVTDALGNLLDYGIDNLSGGAFDKTNRLGRIRINNYDSPVSTSGATLAWLYYNSATTQGSAAGTIGGGGQNGWIELSNPSGRDIFAHASPRPGGTLPPFSVQKSASERKDIWIRYPVGNTWTPANGANLADELYYVTSDVLDTSGASVPTMTDTDEIRFVWVPRGAVRGTWARIPLIAGTTGTNYTMSVLGRIIGLSTGLTPARAQHDTRIAVYCRDVRLTS